MTERFLQMSVQAGALILASTLLRILCLHRLPKAVFPALWAAAVARLLFPFSVSARWSIYGLVHSNGATGTSVSSAAGGTAVSVTVQQTTPVGTALYMPAISVAVQIYLGIAAALLLAFALLYVRSFWRFRTAVPVSSDCAVDAWKASHRLLRSLCILRSPATETPLAMGDTSPKNHFASRAGCKTAAAGLHPDPRILPPLPLRPASESIGTLRCRIALVQSARLAHACAAQPRYRTGLRCICASAHGRRTARLCALPAGDGRSKLCGDGLLFQH